MIDNRGIMKEKLERIIHPTLQQTANGMREIIQTCERHGHYMTKKQISEFISGVVESQLVNEATKIGHRCLAPKRDDKADIILDDSPLEIKTCYRTSESWRGGDYCKRSAGDYLMIKYDMSDVGSDRMEFYWFAMYVVLKKTDWTRVKKKKGKKSYYATKIWMCDMLHGDIMLGDKQKKISRWHPTYDYVG